MARASSVLPVPGGADQQAALGNLAAQALELLRIFQEIHQLGQLLFGFVDTGHIVKRDFLGFFGKQPGTRLAEPPWPHRARRLCPASGA